MQFNKILATAAVLVSAYPVGGQLSSLTSAPQCAQFPTITFQGFGEFVDVDSSGLTFPTTGDMSIAVSLLPTGPLPSSPLKVKKFEIKAICIATSNAPPFEAPTCFLEASLKFCKPLVAVEADVDVVKDNGGRSLEATEMLRSRILIDDAEKELIEKDIALSKCYGTREGKFFAHGTGPEPFAITGGTDKLFGAFGEVVTDGSFTSTPAIGGVTLSFDAEVKVCYWP